MVLRFLILLSAFTIFSCDDPCEVLAKRVCDCEPSVLARRQCRAERIDVLSRQVSPSDEQLSFCTAALDTCTCEALDENMTEACGFTNDGAF